MLQSPNKPISTLASAKVGERLRVVTICPDCPECLRLRELGFQDRVEVRKIADGAAFNVHRPERRMTLKEIARVGKKRGFSLEAMGVYKPPTMPENTQTGQSMRAFVTYLFGSHVCQLLVDTETGEVKIERYIACHDVGKAINPDQVIGQIQGGVAQGICWGLWEEVTFKEGRMANNQLTNYIIPTASDLPHIRVVFLEAGGNPFGPGGAKGIGELPMDGPAPAVLNALRDALGPLRLDELPMTPERILNRVEEARHV